MLVCVAKVSICTLLLYKFQLAIRRYQVLLQLLYVLLQLHLLVKLIFFLFVFFLSSNSVLYLARVAEVPGPCVSCYVMDIEGGALLLYPSRD